MERDSAIKHASGKAAYCRREFRSSLSLSSLVSDHSVLRQGFETHFCKRRMAAHLGMYPYVIGEKEKDYVDHVSEGSAGENAPA